MAIIVHPNFPSIEESAAQIKVIGSGARLTLPMVQGANHILGWKQNSLLHWQTVDLQAYGAPEGTYRFYTYRHANSEELIYYFQILEQESSGDLKIQAGNGAVADRNFTYHEGPITVTGTVEWADADTGWCEVTYELIDCKLCSAMFMAAPRGRMGDESSGTDIYVNDHSVVSGVRAGLRPGDYSVYRADGDLYDIDDALEGATETTLQQAVSWTTTEADYGAFSSVSTTYQNIYPYTGSEYFKFYHKAPQIYSDDATQTYKAYIYGYADGMDDKNGDYWQVTVTTGQGTYTSSQITTADAQWIEITGIECDCTDDDYFEVKAQIKDYWAIGDPEAIIQAVSIQMAPL